MTDLLDDPHRLDAVAALALVGAPTEERFDRVTRTAQRVLAAPVALLNLLDDEALWVTSGVGLAQRSFARDTALCSHVVRDGAPLLVGDTAADPRFAANPHVTGDDGVRAYAGHPLRGPSGQVVGTLCVMDVVPRTWTELDAAALADLSTWAEGELAHGEVLRRLTEGDRLRAEYESVLDHAGQGIIGVDREGTVLLANVAALRLTGWQEAGLVGRDLHETLHPVGPDGLPCTVDRCEVAKAARRGRTVLRRRDVLWRRDSSTLPVQVSCAPVFDLGVLAGAVLVFDDITEQLAVDRMKDEFVSVVSHELRTPLTSLRGSLGLLASGLLGELSEQGQQMADVAVSSTDRLVRLVDDILDLERLVAGQVVLVRRATPLPDLARSAVQAVAGLAEAAGVRIEVDALDAVGWMDPDRITQVLVNLLGNAVKFSPPGAVVRLTATQPDVGRLLLQVEDHGRGIPADQLERVFDRFAQVDSSDSRDRGGSGLGLAIARNVVEAHGGTITADSTVGVGTTFTVVVPQRRVPSTPRVRGRRSEDPVRP